MPDAISVNRGLSDEQALLEEMVEVLRTVAAIRAPDRSIAVRYTEARAGLVAGRMKPSLPPWLFQCISVFKFHEFINLFAADVGPRIAFIDQCFEGCRSVLRSGRPYDVFGGES